MTTKQSPKRVLHIMRSLDAGGIGAFLMNVYRAIDRSLVQFDFAITNKGMGVFGEEIERLGGRVYFIYEEGNRTKLDGIRQMHKLYSLCRENHYDVVHSHYYFGNGYFLLCAQLAGVGRRVSHCHTAKMQPKSFLTKCFDHISRPILFHTATDLLGCADAATIYLYGEKAFRTGRAKTLYNGIDYDTWDLSRMDVGQLRTAYGLRDEKVVVFVGRLEDVKNPIYALKVVKEVHAKRADIKMFVVGIGTLSEEVDAFIRDNGMEGYVVRMPQDANIRELQAMADVMIAPSLREGLSIAFIEAQKMLTHVVTSDNVSAEADMGLCSFLSLDAPEAWAQCVLSHLDGKDGRTITRHHDDFNVKTAARKLLQIYFPEAF